MDAERPPHRVDAVFCDTCIGGSTVAACVGRRSAGLRACFLADYAVNPLGTKGADEVRAALDETPLRVGETRKPIYPDHIGEDISLNAAGKNEGGL